MSKAQPLAPPLLPQPPRGYDQSYMSRLLETLRVAMSRYVSRDTANDSILLQSPAGKVYSITVSDTGTVTSTYVSG